MEGTGSQGERGWKRNKKERIIKPKADEEIRIRGGGERRGGMGSDKGNRVKMSKQRSHKEKGSG